MRAWRWKLLLLSLLGLGAGLGWLAATESGLQWGLKHLQAALGGRLSIQSATGSLIGPIHLEQVEYSDPRLRLSAGLVRADWRLWPLITGVIYIEEIHAEGIRVVLPGVAAPETGPPSKSKSGSGIKPLPLFLKLGQASLRHLEIVRDDRTVAAIDQLRFGAEASGDKLKLTGLHLETQETTIDLQGQLSLRAHGPLQIDTRWSQQVGEWRLQGHGRLHGDYDHIQFAQTLTLPLAATLDGTVTPDGDRLRWQATLQASPFALNDLVGDGRAVRLQPQLEAAGTLAGGEARLRTPLEDPDLGDWSLSMVARWQGQDWEIPEIRLGNDRGARIDASVSPQTSGLATATGYRAELRWRDLTWPLSGPTALASPEGHLTLSGRPEAYSYQLQAALRQAQLGDTGLSAKGTGTLTGLQIDDLRAQWLEGRWQARLSVDWDRDLRWDGRATVADLDPGGRWSPWPGRLQGGLRFSGRQDSEGLTLDLELERLRGTLRGYPLHASAHATLRNEVLDLDRVELRSGAAHLTASLKTGPTWRAQWDLRAPQLSELLPELAGAMETSGKIQGPLSALSLDASLSAPTIQYRDHRIETLALTAQIDGGPQGAGTIRVHGDRVTVAALPIGGLHLDITGAKAAHEIRLVVGDGPYRLDQALQGSLKEGLWTATLRQGQIVTGEAERWQAAGGALAVAAGDVTMDALCWESAPARLCLDGGYREGKGALSLEWAALPIARLDPLIPLENLGLNGLSDGRVDLAIATNRVERALLRFTVADGGITYVTAATQERHRLEFQEITLRSEATATTGVQGELAVRFTASEHLSAAFRLPGWDINTVVPASSQALESTLTLTVSDLTLVTLFFPEVQPSLGRLEIQLRATGTLAAPHIDGRATLALPELALARLGINMREVELQGEIRNNRWQYHGQLSSGEGRISLQGSGAFQDPQHWHNRMELHGTQVDVVRLPTAWVIASPRLVLTMTPGRIEFSGQVEIPKGRIEPVAPQTTVVVSEDIVFVDQVAAATPTRRWQTAGDIEILLGNDVKVSGQGISTLVTGKLHLAIDPVQGTLARGELHLKEGRYKACRQNLVIDQGRLLFVGGTVENPAIDIIATRKNLNVQVGVKVTGTAEAPIIELFSIPPMDESDILSYLVLGRPFNQASSAEGQLLQQAAASLACMGSEMVADEIADRFGLQEVSIETGETVEQTALVLGKYLSPRLYVRYLQGLIDNSAALQIRYQINEKWTVETESGSRASSGADLLYTFDR